MMSQAPDSIWLAIADLLCLADLLGLCHIPRFFGPVNPKTVPAYWRARFSAEEIENASIKLPFSITVSLWKVHRHTCGVRYETMRRHTRRLKTAGPKVYKTRTSHALCDLADYHLRALAFACLAGWIRKAEWLVSAYYLYPTRCTHLFYKVCRAGHLAVARWLLRPLSKSGPGYKMCTRGGDYYSFRLACAHGHLELAQWLAHKLRSFALVAVMARNSRAFIAACSGGHYTVANWLVTEFVLSHRGANLALAIKRAEAANQTRIVTWLSACFEMPRD